MSTSVEKIKERLDIAEVLGSYIKLEKAGSNFKAKCPFHNEKSPSFFISTSRGTYYCFGCGMKGDIFTFVEEFEGLDFKGALKLLAERAGVELEAVNTTERNENDRLREVLEIATQYFVQNLKDKSAARDYLLERGLTQETIDAWRLGYVPNEWRALSTYLRSKKVSDAEMIKVGLTKMSEKAREDGMYDIFRGRIIFPIFDTSGRVIAFSGRIFDEVPDAPKYLNSPETPLFVKSETLYGFDRAKTSIRKRDYTILVEGQMDLLMCHQAGFDNTVASSGTAFTKEHLAKLERLSKRIIFAYDSDGAGFTAANKSAVLALSLKLEVKLCELPKGSDPAELIKNDPSSWKESLKNAKHLIDFYLDKLMLDKLESRALAKEIEKKVLPYVSMLESSIEQSHFISQIAKRTGIREDAIWTDVRKLPRVQGETRNDSPPAHSVPVIETKNRKNYIERRLFGVIFWQEKEKEPQVDIIRLRATLILIAGDKYIHDLVEHFKPLAEELIFEAESYYGETAALTREISELIINFEEDVLREQFVKVMKELSEAEHQKDKERSAKLLESCQEISQKLAELSRRRLSGE